MLGSTVLALFCASTFAAALPNDLFSRQLQQCRHQYYPSNGRLYTVSCDVDRPGGDYTNLQADTIATCLNACTSDSRCASATFNPVSKFCYLKNTVTYESLSTGQTTIVIGTGCQNRQRNVGGRQCTVQCASDYVGLPYKQQFYGSFEACVQACGGDSQCANAQYYEDSGLCLFKSIVFGIQIPNPNVDTITCAK